VEEVPVAPLREAREHDLACGGRWRDVGLGAAPQRRSFDQLDAAEA
jgi:hypothetical protein